MYRLSFILMLALSTANCCEECWDELEIKISNIDRILYAGQLCESQEIYLSGVYRGLLEGQRIIRENHGQTLKRN